MFGAAVAMAALPLLVAGLLAVPITFVIDGERKDVWTTRWQAQWLFGLVTIDSSRSFASSAPATAAAAAADTGTGGSGRRARKARRARSSTAVAVLRTKGFVGRIVRLVSTLFGQLRIKSLHADLVFGLDDPADTGMVYGSLMPLFLLADGEWRHVRCRPSFDGAGVWGAFGASVRVRPLAVVWAIVVFVVSPPSLRAMWTVWRTRS